MTTSEDVVFGSSRKTNQAVCAHLSLPCRHLTSSSSSDRCSFFLLPTTPRNSQFYIDNEAFESNTRTTSPRTQAPLILDREALRASTHTLYHSDDLSFPYPIPTSPSPIFNTCLLLTLYVTYVNPLISLACHAAPARFSPLGLPAESCRTKRCLQLVCSTLLFESIFLLLDPGGNPYPCYPRSTRTPGR